MPITDKEISYIRNNTNGPKNNLNRHLKSIHNHFLRYEVDSSEFWVVAFDDVGNTVSYDGGHPSYEKAKKDGLEKMRGLARTFGKTERTYRIIKVFPETFEG